MQLLQGAPAQPDGEPADGGSAPELAVQGKLCVSVCQGFPATATCPEGSHNQHQGQALHCSWPPAGLENKQGRSPGRKPCAEVSTLL